MTDAAARGPKPDVAPQPSDLDEAGRSPRETDTGGANRAPDSRDRPIFVGHWILRLPLGAPVRAFYEEQVIMFNRDLTAYFDSNNHISEANRRLVREQFQPSLKLMNGYHAWVPVINRYSEAGGVTIGPLLPVLATVASVLTGTSTSMTNKLAYLLPYLFLSLLFLLRFFAIYLRTQIIRLAFWYDKLLALLVAVGSCWLIFGVPSKLGSLEAGGVLLISLLGTIVLTAVEIVVLTINNVPMRAAIYLTGIGVLAFAATSTQPNWPPWLVRGVWSALWAALILVIAIGAFLTLLSLAFILLERWKNRRYVVAELVRVLVSLGLRLEDKERPEDERSELSRVYPEFNVVLELEYIAELVENFLPRRLRTFDRSGDSIIVERCRGMAAAVRQLKLSLVLNQSTSSREIAGRIVPAIAPILLGEWDRIAYVTQSEQLMPSKWKRALRVFGRVVAALVPPALVLILRFTGIISNTIFEQVLPLVVTWLLVFIVNWLDPRTRERLSSFETVGDMMRTLR